MATNQPLSNANVVPVIETVLAASPPIVAAHPTTSAAVNTGGWKAVEDQIAALAPSDGTPGTRTDDDGYLLPNRKTVAVARQIAARLRDSGIEAPLRFGQTANAGIKFEWRAGNRTERLTVDAHGAMELVRFEESRLVSRKSIQFESAQQ